MTSAALSPISSPAPQFEAANFLNLLIIDDERTIREACREVAHSLGFTAHVADSAEQAYRMLDLQAFDAVLLCPARADSMHCGASRSGGPMRSSLW